MLSPFFSRYRDKKGRFRSVFLSEETISCFYLPVYSRHPAGNFIYLPGKSLSAAGKINYEPGEENYDRAKKVYRGRNGSGTG